jgi:hypothetical protein
MAEAAKIRIDFSRMHDRVTINAPVDLRHFGQEHWHNRGKCTDVSEGGLGVIVEAVFRVGEVLELRFPGAEEEIQYRARVIYRRNSYHYGIEFMEAMRASAESTRQGDALPQNPTHS